MRMATVTIILERLKANIVKKRSYMVREKLVFRFTVFVKFGPSTEDFKGFEDLKKDKRFGCNEEAIVETVG